ncbi:hypothetical protein ISN76_10620 [Dyella halodurans]|uniref:Uncharacterized protein n=1 Tax=Dyella halodurans TaxID=1920171 RepID=A0ABV9C2B9_9GAMM|nr:hypothetical protein [Dyella halodurans]
MGSFFDYVEPQAASDIADLSRRMYEVREARKRLFIEAACLDADAMLAAVRDGRLPEHPGYEGWLAAQLMREHEQALEAALLWRCREANGEPALAAPALTGLAALAAALERELPSTFAGSMRTHHDGLAFQSDDGIDVMLRIVTPVAWSFEWRWRDALWRLDTAPVAHPGITTQAHLHRPDGSVVDDPAPRPHNEDAVAIARHFLHALAQSPVLGCA